MTSDLGRSINHQVNQSATWSVIMYRLIEVRWNGRYRGVRRDSAGLEMADTAEVEEVEVKEESRR